MKRVDFKIIFGQGKKNIELLEIPTYSFPLGLVVITDKDISEISTNKAMTDLICGQNIYDYPEIQEDNFITDIFIKEVE